MTTYNPAQVNEGVLYPCHGLTVQFYVEDDDRISLQMYQRSCDYGLGVPFNIASYGILLHIVVMLVNSQNEKIEGKCYRPGRLIMLFGDTHIYDEHNTQMIEIYNRWTNTHLFPLLKINKKITNVDEINELTYDDFKIIGYKCESTIKMEMIA